jgi:ABC-2 type transport system ATP-binding protein
VSAAATLSEREPALLVEGVSFAYGQRRALDMVSLAVPPGRMTALLGPNGAGKSTLMHLICRMFVPAAGRIRIAGADLAEARHRALAGMGIVFQERTLDLDLSVEQNLMHAARLRGLPRAVAMARIERELAAVSLADQRHRRAGELNGGHRRRIEIARALLHDPALLIADEASVGLDIPTRQAVLAHVRALTRERGLAVLWATHLVDEVAPGDNLVVLAGGRVVAAGEAGAVMAAAGAGDLATAFRHLTAARPTGEAGA